MNDSVGKFCTDKRTRRKKHGLEEYERHKKHFENPSLSMRTRISAYHASFAPFVPYEWFIFFLSGHAIKISQQSHKSAPTAVSSSFMISRVFCERSLLSQPFRRRI